MKFRPGALSRWAGVVLLASLAEVGAVALQAQQAALDSVAAWYWRAVLDRYPERVTLNGFAGQRNGALTDLAPAAFAGYEGQLRDLLRGAAGIDPVPLAPPARIDLAMLQTSISRELAAASCHRELWEVNQQAGPQVSLLDLAALQKVATAEEQALVLHRWRQIPGYLAQYSADLRAGLDSGLVAPRINVERVLSQLDRLIASPLDASPLLAPARRATGAGAQLFAGQLREITRTAVLPAFRQLRDLLNQQVLPKARREVGLSALPGGPACYRALIRVHTSLDLGADEIHGIGRELVAGIRAEMLVVARSRFHTENLDSLIAGLRLDHSLGFDNREQVLQAAVEATRGMERRLPALFGLRPNHPLVVERMPGYQEVDAPSAFYFPGTPDGSRPGRYLVNTYHPPSRPRYTAEVLAFHEGVPGHHLQISVAQQLPLPDFRRYGDGETAYVEGWALYTERLADEMGAYQDDLSRLGMLAFQSWRACRLVVDTGLHALGWTRQQAIDYMLANLPLSQPDIENEVDRYIADPGQALGYMIGEREILRLRQAARASLGARFDLRQFHDLVLGSGPVTLPILDTLVTHWNPEPK
ncbi:MAG: DUF885 domain-containing protein [Gemmatimonadota bacterium]